MDDQWNSAMNRIIFTEDGARLMDKDEFTCDQCHKVRKDKEHGWMGKRIEDRGYTLCMDCYQQ